jgi:hypothetical protein
MAGLVPAIHAAPLQTTFEVGDGFSAWMPGTRPGMTYYCNRKLFSDSLPFWGMVREGTRPFRGGGNAPLSLEDLQFWNH